MLIEYNTKEFPFAEVMEAVLGVDNLTQVHKDERGAWDMIERSTDQYTPLHPLYYDAFNDRFCDMWERFVASVIAPNFNEDFLFQKIPTFRVQIPGNVAVGEWHKDSKYGHQEGALNVFLPMVNTNDYNCVWAESMPDKGDYSPAISCKYGQIILWDGVRLRHGNKINESNETRVSVDARILPCSKVSDKENKSINMETPLVDGAYYKKHRSVQ